MNSSPTAVPPFGHRISGADRILAAGNLLIALFLLSAFCMAIVTIDGRFRTDEPDTTHLTLFRELGLQYPAVIPSGRMLRQPEFARDGVDLRFSPTLPRIGTEPAFLILPFNGVKP